MQPSERSSFSGGRGGLVPRALLSEGLVWPAPAEFELSADGGSLAFASSPAAVSVLERPTSAEPGSLDLHEGLGASAPIWKRPIECDRWPEALRLRSSRGVYVKGRCRATNLCAYCAMLHAVENVEMLHADAMVNAPTVLMVLTTRRSTLGTAEFKRARAELFRAMRSRWADVEYASLLEYTTGYGPRSGGLQRPHWNFPLKGLDVERDSDELLSLVERHWCRDGRATMAGQHVGPIYAAGGLIKYLAMHFQKAAQTPPAGFRGQRFNCSLGYFGDLTRAQARAAAKVALREKRALWRALRDGYSGNEAEVMAALDLAVAAGETFELVGVVERIGDLVVSARGVRGPAPAPKSAVRLIRVGGDLVDATSGEVWT